QEHTSATISPAISLTILSNRSCAVPEPAIRSRSRDNRRRALIALGGVASGGRRFAGGRFMNPPSSMAPLISAASRAGYGHWAIFPERLSAKVQGGFGLADQFRQNIGDRLFRLD